MIICKICGIEKPNEEFYLFKNPNGEAKRRKRCKICITKREDARYWVKKSQMIQTPQPIETPPQIASNEFIETRICRNCNKEKPITEFYPKKRQSQPGNPNYTKACKKCYNQKKPNDDPWKIFDYKANPGEWVNDGQRDVVYSILENMGWSMNDNKVWYKEGIKNKDGKFENLKKYTIPYNRRLIINDEDLIELRRKKVTFDKIASMYNTTKNTVVSRYYKLINGKN